MRARVTFVLGVILAFLVTGIAVPAAHATDPGQLGSGYVTDQAGVLSGGELAASEERLSTLFDDAGVNLYVAFVDTFTNPADAADWANETFDLNNLGPHQYLLAVAVEGRAYYLSAHQNGALSDDQLGAIENAIQPQLSSQNWAGAITTAADRMQAELAAPTNPLVPSAGDGFMGILMFLIFAGVIALIIWLIVRARRKKTAKPQITASADPYATVSDEDLERQAGSALVQADDAITSSKEELGFAIAQFGDASTETFTATVDAAQQKVAEAFSLKQKLDDDIPDTREQRRAWHAEIIALCQQASDLLDDNLEAFDALRELERNAPQALEQVRAQRAQLDAKIAAAPAVLARLASTYSDAALSTVADNADQARGRLSLADTQIADADAKLAAGQTGEAAFAIRTAEEGVLQAGQLLAAIDSIGADLGAIEAQAQALIADLEADLAAAAQLPDATGQLAAIAANTRAHVDQARGHLQGTARNPQQLLESLDAANTQIDTTIAQVRDAVEQGRRRQQMLEQKLLQAQAQIRAASEFITTRRGAVGATARTRLAEADVSLQQAIALQQSSPAQALQHATRALALAGEATRAAESDVRSYSAPGYGGGGGGSSMGSDILGGIIGGIISSSRSGGSSRGGWGSGPSLGGGWSSGGSRSRSGGVGFRPTSFGGSRSRSGGGRF